VKQRRGGRTYLANHHFVRGIKSRRKTGCKPFITHSAKHQIHTCFVCSKVAQDRKCLFLYLRIGVIREPVVIARCVDADENGKTGTYSARCGHRRWVMAMSFIPEVLLDKRFLMVHRTFTRISWLSIANSCISLRIKPSSSMTFHGLSIRKQPRLRRLTVRRGENSLTRLHTVAKAAAVTRISSSSFLKILYTAIPAPLSVMFVRMTAASRLRERKQ